MGSCRCYLVHLDSKKLVDVTFFVAINDGSVLLSCKTTLVLGLIQPRSRPDYLPPTLAWSQLCWLPKKTKLLKVSVHTSKQKLSTQNQTGRSGHWNSSDNNCKETRCEQAVNKYIPDSNTLFWGVWRNWQVSWVHHTIYSLIQVFPSKQTPWHPVPIHLKESFKQEIDKMLKAGIMKPVHEATPWINSFVLVEGKDKLRGLKLYICLDLTNLNKAIIREPYHFRTLEDIAHLFAGILYNDSVWLQEDILAPRIGWSFLFLTTFNTEIGCFMYTVMPFGATVVGDVFQHKIDQCCGHIKDVIVIADDIMLVGRQHNHRNHDQALTTLLETARKCNIRLNYEKLQYKQEEVDIFGDTYTTNGCKPAHSKVRAINEMPAPTCKKQVQSFIGMINYLFKFSPRLSELAEPIRELCKEKVPFNLLP